MKKILSPFKRVQLRISILILFFYLLAISCHKKPVEDPLHPTNYPSPTYIGADKIVCRIDGEYFETSSNGSRIMGTYPIEVSYDTSTQRFQINGFDKGEIKSGVSRQISIKVSGVKNITTYDLMPRFNYYSSRFNSASISNNTSEVFETDSLYNGNVRITKLDVNIQKRIICGTFSFKALNKKTNRITVVSDGWFDLVYY
ncbi:MAG: hypothetical protein RJA07_101 [Bacteroidota bacterium]|jgi:hypothetical protein